LILYTKQKTSPRHLQPLYTNLNIQGRDPQGGASQSAAPPAFGINPSPDAKRHHLPPNQIYKYRLEHKVQAEIRPICDPRYMPVLYLIVVNIINMVLMVTLVTDERFPKKSLANALRSIFMAPFRKSLPCRNFYCISRYDKNIDSKFTTLSYNKNRPLQNHCYVYAHHELNASRGR
jgi:hypothetical protein